MKTQSNKLKEVLDSITTTELVQAVFEYKRLAENGILEQGIVRATATKIVEHCGLTANDARNILEKYVMRTAAETWANNMYKNG